MGKSMRPLWQMFGVLSAMLVFSVGLGQEKKPEKKDHPRVALSIPLGAPLGTPTKVIVRGLKLDTATEVRFLDPRATAKILAKGKAAVPQKQEPSQIGDTQVEIEVTLPAGMPINDAYFVVATSNGDTAPHQLLVNGAVPVVPEKEPNNGFQQAQPIQLPQAIDGAISQAQDVDVFRLEGQAGQKIVCEVYAARHGSALDSILTLYSLAGRIVASNDDYEGSPDSRLEVTLPEAGAYYLSLSDAHDQGGPAHVYRLVVRPVK